uniref:M superfamily MMSK group conopeptide S3-G03 n=1 Tax=Conus striatus TaxID=6493 RepID=H2BKG3_CONST|nr:M superfamily MMSK group conopeptide S3-G03 [Conus striatus]
MMSKLGVLLTICLLLFPLTALPMDEDQPADQLEDRMQDDISSEQYPSFVRRQKCCGEGSSCPKYFKNNFICGCC